MRVKVFSAPTTAQAMEDIRLAMGAQAIIISSRGGANGVPAEVMAAVAQDDEDAHPPHANDLENPPSTVPAGTEEELRGPALVPFLRQTLRHHGTPAPLCDRLVDIAGHLEAPGPELALAGALDALLSFRPFPEATPDAPATRWIVIGPPGAGKTVALAKLAARSALAGRPVTLITGDTERAGGTAQIETFARIMKCDARLLHKDDDPRATLREEDARHDVFIDTQSINPFDEGDLRRTEDVIIATGATPILVMAAGTDALESADMAASCARLGVKSLLITRLDMTARLGGILASAYAATLPLCAFTDSPQIAHPPVSVGPVGLARLILPDANEKETPSRQTGTIEAIS